MTQNSNRIAPSSSSKIPRKTGFVFEDVGYRGLQTSHHINADWLAVQAAGDPPAKKRSTNWGPVVGTWIAGLATAAASLSAASSQHFQALRRHQSARHHKARN
jgi:hypothetical protein